MSKRNWQLLTEIALIGLFIGFLIAAGIELRRWLYDEPELISPYVETSFIAPAPVYAAEPVETYSLIKTGKVSYYSHAGCLGCSKNQITKSGEPFDENALTLAIPAQWLRDIPMGSMVRVTNLDNGLTVIAKANDTGGFLKYNRVADLSLATCKAVKCETNESTIELKVINND